MVSDAAGKSDSIVSQRSNPCDLQKRGQNMTYYGTKELVDSFRTVRKNTILIAEEIPEVKYSFAAAPDTRTVEKLLVHIAISHWWQDQIHLEKRTTMEGFDFQPLMQRVMQEEGRSHTKAEVLDLLRKEGEIWANFVAGLSEDFLSQSITNMAGGTPPSRTRFEMILSAKEHEMHHRGQLMLMQRMIGIVPHLTRAMQERMAQMQQQIQAKKGA
jgi:uncharacterized damage-inducible protein DinB